jgi:hypothetical protein
MTSRTSGCFVVFALLAGCGGASPPPAKPAPKAGGPVRIEHPVAGREVFDAKAQSVTCGAPEPSCPSPPTAPRELLDRCKLAGFSTVQCGCDLYCTGNAMKERMHYDADGNAKSCAPEQKDCTPPDTSAAFQDACTESGHKFVVCGCEWLCDGKAK